MKSLCHHLLLVLAAALVAYLAVLFYTARHDTLDTLLQHYSHHSSTTVRPAVAPKSLWNPRQKYLVYLPFEGISNQFYSFQNAATIAKQLNRTLVVPPITSNRHDRLGTHQPWSHYMDLENMSIHAGIPLVEWHDIKHIDPASRRIVESGSRLHAPKAWKRRAERFPCQVVRNYGHDYFTGQEDSIGADFAYQYLLDLVPVPVPGFSLNDSASFVGDIVGHNQDSTDPIICLTFTFTAHFERDRNRWDIGWNEAGQHLRFLPRFASYVEDLIAYRFGELQNHVHPHPPLDLGTSILDKGPDAETFLSRKAPRKEYIAIHLRRGDIAVKCAAKTFSDCIVPLSVYKTHVEGIISSLPKGVEQPSVVLVSDTQSEEEKQEIDSYGWYRLDHSVDPNLLDAAHVLGPFSPALIDSAVMTGRGARWVIGSRRSTMSWLAAMRISSWYNRTIVYPRRTAQQLAFDLDSEQRGGARTNKFSGRDDLAKFEVESRFEQDGIVIWDRHEMRFFDHLTSSSAS
ncbi:hypothetical protein B0O80DRAFT_523611 [Mortierella sp. GBAus27b]|nr:hypothetical protein B0O80DRAFT_523611 [Mortierella sp. GBAus27b]